MDVQRIPDNRTPMAVRCAVMDDPAGREQLVTIAKLTWRVAPDGAVSLAASQPPPRLTAVLRGASPSSLRYPDDGVQLRPGTNVVLLGTAHPPVGRPVTSVDVVLRVSDDDDVRLAKRIRVHGPRVWQEGLQGIVPGPAADLAPTPLVYENAFGGVDDSDPQRPVYFEPNPVGTGFFVDPKRRVGSPAPPLEDPDAPLSAKVPAAACFGPIPSHWAPLARYGGTHDETWQRRRAPIRPLDYDPRHEGCAPDDQRCEPALRGDEVFEIVGVRPEGPWRFRLPLYRPQFVAQRRDEAQLRPLATHLDTVFIDADEGVVELTWRASVPLPIVPQLLQWVRIGSLDPLPDHVRAQLMTAAREHQEGPA